MSDYVHQIDDNEWREINRFLRWLALGIVAFILVVIALYMTADRWLMAVSPEAERRFSEPYVELARVHLLPPGDPVLQEYVESLVGRLARRTDIKVPITVTVVEGDIVNAFAILGGHIFVYEGLMRELDNENALAMVLAHELAHASERHALQGAGRGILLQLAIATITGTGMDPQSLTLGADVALLSHSRGQEFAADDLALVLLQREYGHVGGATQLFDNLQSEDPDEQMLELLSTHPYNSARIERIRSRAATAGWVERATQAYPQAVRDALRVSEDED